MSVFNHPLGFGITHNPLLESPFIADSYSGNTQPPGPPEAILTEDGVFILTEDGHFLAAE